MTLRLVSQEVAVIVILIWIFLFPRKDPARFPKLAAGVFTYRQSSSGNGDEHMFRQALDSELLGPLSGVILFGFLQMPIKISLFVLLNKRLAVSSLTSVDQNSDLIPFQPLF